jgi:hypothetical protein
MVSISFPQWKLQEDKDTGELSKKPVVTHLSYKIVVPGKETIFRGFYPKQDEDTKNSINTLKSLFVKSEGAYVDDAERLELARGVGCSESRRSSITYKENTIH